MDDARGRVVTVSRHFGDEDPLRVYAVLQRDSDPRVVAHFRTHGIYDWSTPGRVPAEPALDFKARVCCPARAHGFLFGHLFLIDDGVADWEIELAAAVATEVGSLMYRRVILHERASARREELARDLVADAAPTRERARHALADELDLVADPVVAVAVEFTGPPGRTPDAGTALRAAVERATRDRLAGRSLATVHGHRALLLLLCGDAATAGTGRDLATRMLDELAGRDRVVAGIGVPGTGDDAAVRTRSGARLAAHAAALLPFLGDVVDEDDLGVYGVLLRLPRSELTPSRLPAGLRRLLEHDSGDVLVETLETYLDCCGDATRTAAQLRVHRSTLYYRLGRIETVTGAGRHDGATRLALHLGVKLHRVLDAYRAHPELLPAP